MTRVICSAWCSGKRRACNAALSGGLAGRRKCLRRARCALRVSPEEWFSGPPRFPLSRSGAAIWQSRQGIPSCRPGLHRAAVAQVSGAGRPWRLHGDDTTVPLLARGGTRTARLWTYVRDDRPFGGAAPPAVVFRFSRDHTGEHPTAHPKGCMGSCRLMHGPATTSSTIPADSPAQVLRTRRRGNQYPQGQIGVVRLI